MYLNLSLLPLFEHPESTIRSTNKHRAHVTVTTTTTTNDICDYQRRTIAIYCVHGVPDLIEKSMLR